MRFLKVILISVICVSMLVLSSCSIFNSISVNNNEIKIGVSGISGQFNPFYCETEADKQIVTQTARPIQRVSTNNTLVNHSGGISYEITSDEKIKYTVSIKDNMMFSDGTNITIDDVIFFYYFISDATYDGVYKDWYLNDIEGLKEYYFDDKNYESSINTIENTVNEKYTLSTITADDFVKYLVATNLEGKFDGDINSLSPSGNSWKEYIDKLGYTEAYNDLGNKPAAEQLLKLVATVESENNPLAYNPESWYREQLYNRYIEKNYSDGIDVTEISGIKKINDYTCTVFFDSKNINAVSQLNAFLVSKNYYSAEYVKGSADKVKEINGISSVCSGPYVVTEYDNNKVIADFNEYYTDADCEFNRLEFIETSADNAVKDVSSGKIDVVSVEASSSVVNSLTDKPVAYYITNKNEYVSAFFNTRTLETSARMALSGLFSVNSVLESEIGSYYTRLISPISIRFNEYPSKITNPYYTETAFSAYKTYASDPVENLTAYCISDENSLQYKVLEAYKSILSQNGIALDIILCDEDEFRNAILSGETDLWLETVPDGATCDKYEYYNSFGKHNYTALSSPDIDEMTSKIRTSVGFYNKAEMTETLIKLVMEQAVEFPIYQLQVITIYNTDTIKPESLEGLDDYDGFAYIIPYLEEK
ncbi:MAG: hypothetical protein IKJ41_12170 [Clostridia bacterium]|nr:hypothetical protein [Clostridia bacterium]